MPRHIQLDEDGDPATHSATVFVKAPEHAYAAVYSPLRQYLRRLVTTQVDREMPYLANIQQRFRTPALDCFFVLTGMLGNHAFFLLGLPFLHFYGLGVFARGLTAVVLWSVYFSGVVKDYIGSHRPVSPPVVQITRSPAHILEYGFPSSHTTYVVAAIGYLSYFMLNIWDTPLIWTGILWGVGLIIVVGRIYCGLHSFIDVVGGTVIGLMEAALFVVFYDKLDELSISSAGPLYISAILYMALSTIPRSLDLCPCCVDTFCATSVTLGLSVSAWIYARLPFLWHDNHHDRIAWDHSLTHAQNAMRCLSALTVIVLWKALSKPWIVSVIKSFMSTPAEPVTVVPGSPCSSADGTDTTVYSGPTTSLVDNAIVADLPKEHYPIPSAEDIKAGRYGTYTLMASAENLARVPIYTGIGLLVGIGAPLMFHYLGLAPT